MKKYILRTTLLADPNRSIFYNGTDNDKDVPFSLNTLIAYRDVDAVQFDKKDAYVLLEKLNAETDELMKIGFSSFEIVEVD